MATPVYQIKRAPATAQANFPEESLWRDASVGRIAEFHAKTGSSHKPVTEFRLMWDESALYLRFNVKDQYVRCIQTAPHAMVYLDSCVEFFVQPAQNGYLNLECNAIGTALCYHITDSARRPEGFAAFRPLTLAELSSIQIFTSLHNVIDPEIATPVNWWLAARIPMKTLAIAQGKVPTPGTRWRGNFFKCGEATSHPHSGSWSSVGEILDFHQPSFFGELLFC